MNIWITGAEGQLGRSLRKALRDASDRCLFTDRELDLTDREAVLRFAREEQIDVVVNCAAYTDVERAETEEQKAYAVNAEAAGYLAEAMREREGLMIHISTDFVFMGGCCALLPETAQPRPINAYGRTKLAGERAIESSGCNYMIWRTAWLYSAYGRNFVKTILRLSAERDELRVVCDEIGSPTYAGDLAEAIAEVIRERRFVGGIYHYTNLGECSRWEFAQEICRLAGRAVRIHPCRAEEYPSAVCRPKNAVLDKTKIQERLALKIPHWKESLKRCLDELQA